MPGRPPISAGSETERTAGRPPDNDDIGMPPDDAVPLFVDLDGTLVRTDVTTEAAFDLIRSNLGYAVLLAVWVLRGTAFLKRQVAARTTPAVETLPYIETFVDYLRQQRAAGRPLVLTTAADQSVADSVAAHLGLFDRAIGSDGVTDLGGKNKLNRIREMVGDGAFDYAGDDLADLWIFSKAREAIVVNPAAPVRAFAARAANVTRVFEPEARHFSDFFQAMRPARWPMNLLVLLPLAFSGQVFDTSSWIAALLGLLSFCLAASASYVFDDLLHLPARRTLPAAERGPIAGSRIALQRAGWALPVLWGVAFVVALALSAAFAATLAAFIVLCVLAAQDRWRLPRLPVAMALSALRAVGGALLVAAPVLGWSLAVGLAAGAAVELSRRAKSGFI